MWKLPLEQGQLVAHVVHYGEKHRPFERLMMDGLYLVNPWFPLFPQQIRINFTQSKYVQ